MILEYAQLLSTAHRMLDGTETTVISDSGRKKKVFKHPDPILDAELYSVTHRNHPSAVWVREHANNYHWVAMCMMNLNHEYRKRYGHNKNHLTIDKIGSHLLKLPHKLWIQDRTTALIPPPQCVADDCKVDDTIHAYRLYYSNHKRDIARWRNGGIPDWFARDVYDETERQEKFGRATPKPDKAKKALLKPEGADVEVMLDEADDWLRQNDPEYA